jgi:hypothetical protein
MEVVSFDVPFIGSGPGGRFGIVWDFFGIAGKLLVALLKPLVEFCFRSNSMVDSKTFDRLPLAW